MTALIDPRWIGPISAEVFHILRDQCAPAPGNLAYNRTMPDPQFGVIRARRPAQDRVLMGPQVDLERTDLGNGSLAERRLVETTKIARILHGGAGEDLVRRIRVGFNRERETISTLIARY